ncbi:MAG: carbohydrate ABC transporter permease [Candidatus Caldatribacteriota bacterium]|nr:carbohydrate ABC transporter permease [Candidatus Caldatribacteriota bacterium]
MKMRKVKIRKSISRIILYLLVTFIVIWTLAPFTWLFLSGLFPHKELLSDRATNWFPENPTFKNFQVMFDIKSHIGQRFMYAFRNSLIISGSVTIICLIFGTLAAYALARLAFPFKNNIVMSLISIRMIPTVALVIPFFVIIRTFDYFFININSSFHFYDTKINLIILYVTFILGFVIWIMRGFFLTIPHELEEAARIDGCTRIQALTKIILPLSAPGLVATGIFTFLLAWDEFVLALVFTKTTNSITVPVFITSLGSQYIHAFDQIAASGFIASLPPIVLALLFQKFLIKGLTAGSTKG